MTKEHGPERVRLGQQVAKEIYDWVDAREGANDHGAELAGRLLRMSNADLLLILKAFREAADANDHCTRCRHGGCRGACDECAPTRCDPSAEHAGPCEDPACWARPSGWTPSDPDVRPWIAWADEATEALRDCMTLLSHVDGLPPLAKARATTQIQRLVGADKRILFAPRRP